MGVAAGRAVPQRVRRVCAGGLALVDQVVAILADRGRLAAGLPEPASGGAAAAGGPPRAAKSFGYLLLWILVIGFLGLAGWRLVQAAVRRLNLTEGHRVRALVYGIGYAMAFLSTLMFVVHGTKPAAGDSSARDYTASCAVPRRRPRHRRRRRDRACRARRRHGGPGLRRRVHPHLHMGWMSRGTRDAVRLGQAEYVARDGHRRHRDRCPGRGGHL